ncbi:hypothetical protein ACE1CI_12380, partial [Aerosakkonemataceae cyanobacterium BLCC-F50]
YLFWFFFFICNLSVGGVSAYTRQTPQQRTCILGAIVTSNQAFEINGASVQVHWFRNSQTLQDVEFKFKRQYPKTAAKNL